ncbi:MAG: TonB-dependent receptor [Candidatus Kapabacteria bacterium]|nr:TonB-dependent receptor [Ignavibacteriota bacterium]MCW5885398.1 TonB-dependent receptor [Candidatus Kapabacteria bacterium]
MTKTLLALIIMLFCLNLNTAFSKDSVKVFYTGELVVLPADEPLNLTSRISEISISEITADRFLTVDNVLQFSQGIIFQKNTRNEAFIRLRGYDQRQIGIFFDGVPISSPYDGALDLSIFSLSNVSKINISRNMPSMYYGSNSIGGTINIVTDNIYKSNSVYGNVQVGEISDSYQLGFDYNLSKFSFQVNANYISNNNFRCADPDDMFSTQVVPNSKSNMLNTYAKVGFVASDNSIFSLSYLLGRADKQIPVNQLTTRPRYWQMPEINRDIVNFTHYYKLSEAFTVRGNVYYEKSYNLLKSFDDSTFSSQNARSSFSSIYDDYKFGGNLITEINTGLADLTKLSINYQLDNHRAQANTGLDWTEYETSMMTLAAEQNFSYDKFTALAGLSYDMLVPHNANGNELRENANNLNYHLGTSYRFDEINIFANISMKSRFPTQKEFYSEISGTALQNPNLKAETGQNVELGFTYYPEKIQDISFSGSIYHNNVSNLIEVVFLPDNFRQFQNFGKAVFTGAEIKTDYRKENYFLSLGYSYLSAENLSDNAEAKTMVNRPMHTLIFSGSVSIFKYYNIYLDGLYYLEQYTNNPDTRKIEKLDDYILLNLSLDRNFKYHSFYFVFNNLLNQFYYTEWGLPQQGFSFQAGVRLNVR